MWANRLKFTYFITTTNLRFGAIVKAILIKALKLMQITILGPKINLRRLEQSLVFKKGKTIFGY
jgi:hypothetical protein